jgi:dihydrodipicolinate synthase/N-acetylneuraminate lyase
LSESEIAGTWATVLTPFDGDDRLDLAALEHHVRVLLASRPQGLYTHGTAGEFFNQTQDEWGAVAKLVASACESAGMPFQLGAGHPSPVLAIERIRAAAALEPSAIQVVLPDWLPLSWTEVVETVRRYAAAADGIGLVLYNPPHAKNVLDAEQLLRLCDTAEQIIGLKVADGDPEWYADMAPLMSRVSVFVPGHHVATGLSRGARGAYSNMACFHPSAATAWAARSVDDPDWGIAVERRIAAFMRMAIEPMQARGYGPVTLDKALAAAGGRVGDVGGPRWPHTAASPREIDTIRRAALQLLPSWFAPREGTNRT